MGLPFPFLTSGGVAHAAKDMVNTAEMKIDDHFGKLPEKIFTFNNLLFEFIIAIKKT
jgi:hypothetical protein